MAKLILKMSLDDDTFSDETGGDRDFAIAAVFKELIEKLMAGHLDLEYGDNVYDANGNHIGWVEITEDWSE